MPKEKTLIISLFAAIRKNFPPIKRKEYLRLLKVLPNYRKDYLRQHIRIRVSIIHRGGGGQIDRTDRAGALIARRDSPSDRSDRSTCPPDRAEGQSP